MSSVHKNVENSSRKTSANLCKDISLLKIKIVFDLSICLSTQYNMQNEWTYAAA
jgi:hypothetical protein